MIMVACDALRPEIRTAGRFFSGNGLAAAMAPLADFGPAGVTI